jgi:hypothetical protein
MTMFNKQPDKVIVFFSAAILSIPSSYEAYHLPPAFLLPHTQGALRIEALDCRRPAAYTFQPQEPQAYYKTTYIQERRIKTCKDCKDMESHHLPCLFSGP